MHIRYDLKNKLELSKFSLQANYFLNKEDCIFSFYLADFAVSFSVQKENENFKINLNLSELAPPNNNGDSYYQHINQYQDPRFKELFFIKELNDSGGQVSKNTSNQVVDYMMIVVKSLSKLNKLTFII